MATTNPAALTCQNCGDPAEHQDVSWNDGPVCTPCADYRAGFEHGERYAAVHELARAINQCAERLDWATTRLLLLQALEDRGGDGLINGTPNVGMLYEGPGEHPWRVGLRKVD